MAPVAQSVERIHGKDEVGGSIPPGSSKLVFGVHFEIQGFIPTGSTTLMGATFSFERKFEFYRLVHLLRKTDSLGRNE